MYPATGFTKGQVIDYYTRIYPYVGPHLAERPLTLKRYPNGVEGTFFYEKQCPSHRPDWVKTIAVYSRHNKGDINFCVVDQLATLVWLAQLADLELHVDGLRDGPREPAADGLRPGPRAGDRHRRLRARRLLAARHLRSLRPPVVPEDVGVEGVADLRAAQPARRRVRAGHEDLRARACAQLLEKHPDAVVSDMRKDLRQGKVLIDWSQNDEHKTTVCVYSLRAKERPTVSTPVTWDEVEDALAAGDAGRLTFDSADVLDRVERHGDLFDPVVELEQELPEL